MLYFILQNLKKEIEEEMTKYYTLNQASELLHLNPITVTDKIKTGELEAFRTGRKYLISEEQIKQFLEKNKIA